MGRALIICDAPKGTELYKELLSQNDFKGITVVENGHEAKRLLLDKDFEICLINAPLRGENGQELSIDIAEKNICQVILVVKTEYLDEITSRVEDYGVITVGKPISKPLLWSALKLAKVAQRRITMAQRENAKLQSKIEQLKLVSRAKCLLISYEGMTEPEAHRYIEQTAMNDRKPREEIAMSIVNKYE